MNVPLPGKLRPKYSLVIIFSALLFVFSPQPAAADDYEGYKGCKGTWEGTVIGSIPFGSFVLEDVPFNALRGPGDAFGRSKGWDWDYGGPFGLIDDWRIINWKGRCWFEPGRYRFYSRVAEKDRLWVYIGPDGASDTLRLFNQSGEDEEDGDVSEWITISGWADFYVKYYDDKGYAAQNIWWERRSCEENKYPNGEWYACAYSDRNLNNFIDDFDRNYDSDPVTILRHDFGSGGPFGENNNFSVAYRTRVNIPPGPYIFQTDTDDGVRVYLNDQLIINSWGPGSKIRSSDIIVMSGGTERIRVEFNEYSGSAHVILRYFLACPYLSTEISVADEDDPTNFSPLPNDVNSHANEDVIIRIDHESRPFYPDSIEYYDRVKLIGPSYGIPPNDEKYEEDRVPVDIGGGKERTGPFSWFIEQLWNTPRSLVSGGYNDDDYAVESETVVIVGGTEYVLGGPDSDYPIDACYDDNTFTNDACPTDNLDDIGPHDSTQAYMRKENASSWTDVLDFSLLTSDPNVPERIQFGGFHDQEDVNETTRLVQLSEPPPYASDTEQIFGCGLTEFVLSSTGAYQGIENLLQSPPLSLLFPNIDIADKCELFGTNPFGLTQHFENGEVFEFRLTDLKSGTYHYNVGTWVPLLVNPPLILPGVDSFAINPNCSGDEAAFNKALGVWTKPGCFLLDRSDYCSDQADIIVGARACELPKEIKSTPCCPTGIGEESGFFSQVIGALQSIASAVGNVPITGNLGIENYRAARYLSEYSDMFLGRQGEAFDSGIAPKLLPPGDVRIDSLSDLRRSPAWAGFSLANDVTVQELSQFQLLPWAASSFWLGQWLAAKPHEDTTKVLETNAQIMDAINPASVAAFNNLGSGSVASVLQPAPPTGDTRVLKAAKTAAESCTDLVDSSSEDNACFTEQQPVVLGDLVPLLNELITGQQNNEGIFRYRGDLFGVLSRFASCVETDEDDLARNEIYDDGCFSQSFWLPEEQPYDDLALPAESSLRLGFNLGGTAIPGASLFFDNVDLQMRHLGTAVREKQDRTDQKLALPGEEVTKTKLIDAPGQYGILGPVDSSDPGSGPGDEGQDSVLSCQDEIQPGVKRYPSARDTVWTGNSVGALDPQIQNSIKTAASTFNVPECVLGAIASVEGSKLWNLSSSDASKLTTDGYPTGDNAQGWPDAPYTSQEQEVSAMGLYCSPNFAGAAGPVQMTRGPWLSYKPDNPSSHVCNADDAFYTAAQFVSRRVTDFYDYPETWESATSDPLRYRRAGYRYYGSCKVDAPTCNNLGTSYCDFVCRYCGGTEIGCSDPTNSSTP